MESFDAVVIGGGPAGSAAAIYASRASLNTLLLEQGIPGGQIATTDLVENYPGLPTISGVELGEGLLDHARCAGADVRCAAVTALERQDDAAFLVKTPQTEFRALSVIAACGAAPRRAGFTGEDTFRGRGVSYCATCDAMFFRNKRVFVVGGGTTACEEAVFLARFARSVELIVRRDRCRASKGVVDRMLAHENIRVRYLTSIVELAGEALPASITFQDNADGSQYSETYEPGSFGVFVFVGNEPVTQLINPLVELAADGSVLTDEWMATRTAGLFCAGDIRHKALRQAVTAAADGAIAGTAAYRYIERTFWR